MIYSIKFFTKVIESFLPSKFISNFTILKIKQLKYRLGIQKLNLVEFARPDLYPEFEFYSKLKPTLENSSVSTEQVLANIISILSIY